MTAIERYEWLWEQINKSLPNYQDVIRQEWLKALKQAKDKPVLDLLHDSC